MTDRQQSPFVADKTRVPRMDAHQKHRKRSAREKEMDRQFNAPLTSDQDEWAESPNRLDIVGIDTISMDNYLDRAETAAGIALDTGQILATRVADIWAGRSRGTGTENGQQTRLDARSRGIAWTRLWLGQTTVSGNETRGLLRCQRIDNGR